MPWVWVAGLPVGEPVEGATAQARWYDDDGEGRLVAWPSGGRPHPAALRADAAFVDPDGPATDLTAQLLAPGREPLFDDPAVQGLLRGLARWTEVGEGAFTSLTRDSSHWAGALCAGPVEVSLLAALGPVRRSRLEAGFASPRRQVLRGTQRSGGSPWPSPGA